MRYFVVQLAEYFLISTKLGLTQVFAAQVKPTGFCLIKPEIFK
jgi:hypothetical protein